MCTTARPQRLLVREVGKITLEVGSLPLFIKTIGSPSTCITLVRMFDMRLIQISTCVENIWICSSITDLLSSKKMYFDFEVSFSSPNISCHSRIKLEASDSCIWVLFKGTKRKACKLELAWNIQFAFSTKISSIRSHVCKVCGLNSQCNCCGDLLKLNICFRSL